MPPAEINVVALPMKVTVMSIAPGYPAVAGLCADLLARSPTTLNHRRCGRRGEADRVFPRTPPRVPAQGAAVSRRVRNDARPVEFRLRPPADRHGDRVQSGRRRVS